VAFISNLPLHQYQFMKFAAVCRDVASYSLVGRYEPLAGTCYLCRQRTRLYGRGSQRVCRKISGLCREKRYWESANT